MQPLLQALWGGAVFGSVYGLMAVGMTLVYGSLNLLNLAQGALYVAGGYAAFWVATTLGWGAIAGLLAAMAFTAALGAGLHLLIVRPLYGKPGWDNASWIVTVAVAAVLSALALIVFGPRPQPMPSVIEGGVRIGDVVLRYQGMLVCCVSVSLLLGLNVFLRRSRHGLAIRAVSQQSDAAQLVGVPVSRVFLIVMVVSSALAGLAGAMLSSLISLSPTSGDVPLMKALVVVILGGLGSVRGTIVAAYGVGLIEAVVQTYAGATWSLPVLFVLIIGVLMIRPTGLFGVQGVQRA